MQLHVQNRAILKVNITCVGKYDEPTVETKVITSEIWEKSQRQKRQGEVAVIYRLRVNIVIG